MFLLLAMILDNFVDFTLEAKRNTYSIQSDINPADKRHHYGKSKI